MKHGTRTMNNTPNLNSVYLQLFVTGDTTGSGVVIECGGKRNIHLQKIEKSLLQSLESPKIDKSSKSPIPSAKSSSTEVNMSRMDINIASQHLDEKVTPSAASTPSVTASPPRSALNLPQQTWFV